MQTGVLFTIIVAALLQNGYAREISYLNPGGVTYINYGQPSAHENFRPPAFLQYNAAAIPADVKTRHVEFADVQVPTVTAIPIVKHVPTVSRVPITKYELQPALLEKRLEIVKPYLSAGKVKVRRPALQTQIYTIEKRISVGTSNEQIFEYVPKNGPAEVNITQASPESNATIVNTTTCLDLLSMHQVSASDTSSKSFKPNTQNLGNMILANKFDGKLIDYSLLYELINELGDGTTYTNKDGTLITVIEEPDSPNTSNGRTKGADIFESDEKLSKRRVLVCKPIETVREVDVVKPAANIEKISVHEPTFIKTVRVDHVHVPDSIPVVGEILAPTVAHATVPVYRKSIPTLYNYYR